MTELNLISQKLDTSESSKKLKLKILFKKFKYFLKFGIYTIFIYTLLVWVSVCLFVSVKTGERSRSGPNFLWDLVWPKGRFMNYQNFKNLCFVEFWKSTQKILQIRKFLFCFCFILYTKRRCSKIKPQLKVEIEDWREALNFRILL